MGRSSADVNKQTKKKEKDPKGSSLFIGSTEKTFRVLHAFDGPQRHLPLSDIAKRAGLDRSAAQRIVYTLETLGYLRRVHQTRNYALSPKILQFSYDYLRSNELIDKAAPYLLAISRDIGETTNLQELDGADVVFVARFPGQHLVNVDITIGSRLPAVFTATGTAILSRRPSEDLDIVLAQTRLEALTPFSVTDPRKIRDRVQQAAERGYAIVTNETVMGDISIAAAITDEHGVAVAGLNIAVPTTRWTVERAEEELAPYVQVAATSISFSKFKSYAPQTILNRKP